MSKWQVGIYLRLSSDDDDDKAESNSITNQRNLINYYLSNLKDINVYKCYSDDGYTGTDFNRPAFQEMMENIREKRINCVIVKDLSRVGRNYINVGYFIDDTIPRYNLRFISVNDNIDSYLNPESKDSLDVLFKNLMNESFAKDISKKIRTSFAISKRNGNFIGAIAPYGYLKDSDDYHKLVIDKEAEKTVKKIFNLALCGKSRRQIADDLNNNHILTPSNYMKTFYNIKTPGLSSKWTPYMVDAILKNKTYIGYLIQGKVTKVSHKNHKVITVPENDWIVVANHHEPIITEDIFNQVQNILYNRDSRVNNDGNMYKYTGYLKCGDCGSTLHKQHRPNGDITFFYCGAYRKKKICTKHYILESELDSIVLETLNKYIDIISNIEDKIEKNFSVSYVEYEKESKKIKVLELKKELEKYKKLLNCVKSDYEEDNISKNNFERFKEKYMYKINDIRLTIEDLSKNNYRDDNIKIINKIKSTGQLEKITRNIVNEFIERINVYEEKKVEIVFKYRNVYEDALLYLKTKEI